MSEQSSRQRISAPENITSPEKEQSIREEAREVLRGDQKFKRSVAEDAKTIGASIKTGWAKIANAIDSPERNFWDWRKRVNQEKVDKQTERVNSSRFNIVRKARQAKLDKLQSKLEKSTENYNWHDESIKGRTQDRINAKANQRETNLSERQKLIDKRNKALGRRELRREIRQELQESDTRYSRSERKLVINSIKPEQYRKWGSLVRESQKIDKQEKQIRTKVKSVENRIKQINSDSKQNQIEYTRINQEINKLSRDIAVKKASLQELNKELEDMQVAKSSNENTKPGTTGNLDIIDDSLEDDAIERQENEIRILKAEIKIMADREKTIRDRIEELNEQQANNKDRFQKAESDLKIAKVARYEKLKGIQKKKDINKNQRNEILNVIRDGEGGDE